MQRRRGTWLVVAVVLLGLGAVLMLSGQGEEEAPPPPKVEFPRRMRTQERQRMEARRTYVMPVVADAGVTETKPPKPRDPVLAALPRGEGKTVMVFEANAIRHSPIGQLLLECLMKRGGEELKGFREKTGIDPFEDLDRVVVSDEGLMVSGHFGNSRLKEVLATGDAPDYAYGDEAHIYETPPPPPQPEGRVPHWTKPPLTLGLWKDQILVLGETPDGVKEIMDRVEGRGPDEPPVISEGSTYGEMYGVVSVEMLEKMFPKEQREMAKRLAEVARNVELHMDTRSDFAMVAEVRGVDEAKVTDLGKSLGGALSLARMKAQADGETELAQLLDFAKVRPDGTEFKLELAVPLEVIQERLAWCKEQPEAGENSRVDKQP